MAEKRFGNRIPPACQYCEEAIQRTESHVLCRRKGVVALDYVCRKYLYDPTKRNPPRPAQFEVYKPEDFSL